MTHHAQHHADRARAVSSDWRVKRRIRTLAAGAVRTLNLTVADALYAYALTGSAFATLMVLAAPHLEVFLRCIFHGKG
jgi:hypothetical protein